MPQLELFGEKKRRPRKKKGRQPNTVRKLSYLGRYPKLLLGGRWMADTMGARIGDTVHIHYGKNKVTITFVKKPAYNYRKNKTGYGLDNHGALRKR